MAKPLLYKAPPRWQMWAALGGAIAIHLGAVGAYALKREPPPVDLSDIPTATVDATLQPVEDQPTPPPEDIPIPEAPPMPDIQPEFVEESTPPPRQNRPPTKVAPIKAPAAPGMMSMSNAKALAISKPQPPYPYEARAKKITGSGVCVVTVDPASGSVTDATMATSIGNNLLDQSALNTFRRWKFKPGSVTKVKIPITFTMAGASY
jgi:periplasmic protein TonB